MASKSQSGRKSNSGGEGMDKVMEDIKRYFDSSRDYVSENPREAAALAIAAGFAAWALLGTKPGRMALEAGTNYAVPQLGQWFSRNFANAASEIMKNH